MTPCPNPHCACHDPAPDALDKQREAVEEEPEEAVGDVAEDETPTPPDPDRWYDRTIVALSVVLVALLAYALWLLA